MHAYRRMHYANLVQNVVCTCCAYVGKYENGFVWSDQQEKVTYVKAKDAWWHQQWSTSRKRLASLSRSSLAVHCMGVSAFRFPIVGVLSLDYYALPPCTWAHGSMGTCNISVSREWDEHSLVPSPSPQLSSLAEKLLRVIRTASDDSYGEGLGMRLERTRSVGWCTCSRRPH